MIWDYLYYQIVENTNSYIEDYRITIKYGRLLEIVSVNGTRLSQCYPPHSKCVILCEHSLNAAIAVLSVMKAGLIPVVLSKNYGTVHNQKILSHLEPDIAITDNPNLFIDLDTNFEFFMIDEDGIHSVNEQRRQVEPESILDDVAVIMYTSGTTGFPKGSMITEKGLRVDLEGIQAYFPVHSQDTILIARPIYHCAVFTGEFLLGLSTGANIVFQDGEYNPFSIMKIMKEQIITVLCGTPSLLSQLSTLVLRSHFSPSLRLIAISGECLTKNTASGLQKAFPNTSIFNVYGLTEASPRVSYLPAELFKENPESVGIPIKGDEIKIVDEDGKQVKPGKDGYLLVKGPNVMKGYYRDYENRKVTDGWLHTWDVARQDEKGLLYIVGRLDDRINKAGMNIYPKEIENLLQLDDRIEEVLAYAINKNNTDGIGILLVPRKEEQSITIKEIFELASKRLPLYLMPDDIQIVNSIPRNGSGKKFRRKNVGMK